MNTITLRSAAALSVLIAGATLAACAQNTPPDESAERAAREALVAYQDVAERRAMDAGNPHGDRRHRRPPTTDQAERRQLGGNARSQRAARNRRTPIRPSVACGSRKPTEGTGH